MIAPLTIKSPRARKSFKRLFALGVANLLQDDLLGVLRKPAAQILPRQLLFDVLFELDVGNLLARVGQDDVMAGLLQARFIGHDQPAAKRVVLACFAIDRDANVDVFLGEQLLGRGCQCELQRAENDILRHIFFARQRIDQQQNLTAHVRSLLKLPALPIFVAPAFTRRPKIQFRHQPCFVDIRQGDFDDSPGASARVRVCAATNALRRASLANASSVVSCSCNRSSTLATDQLQQAAAQSLAATCRRRRRIQLNVDFLSNKAREVFRAL